MTSLIFRKSAFSPFERAADVYRTAARFVTNAGHNDNSCGMIRARRRRRGHRTHEPPKTSPSEC